MNSIQNIPFDQIRTWVKAENKKGRPMPEIVAELASRSDVTVLSVTDSPEKRHQILVDAILKKESESVNE